MICCYHSKRGFLNLNLIGILDQTILCCVCEGRVKVMFHKGCLAASLAHIYSLDTISTPYDKCDSRKYFQKLQLRTIALNHLSDISLDATFFRRASQMKYTVFQYVPLDASVDNCLLHVTITCSLICTSLQIISFLSPGTVFYSPLVLHIQSSLWKYIE